MPGLYEIDSGLNPRDEEDPAIGHFMAFADLNSDMYTDIVALSEDGSYLNLFYYNPVHMRFFLGNEVHTTDCSTITNVVVGRSPTHLRIFVTCKASSGSTIVRFFDRTDYGYDELKTFLTIERDSQPFIADINGDFLEDVMFTEPNSVKISVAYQGVSNGDEVMITRSFFDSVPLAKAEPDCITRGPSQVRLTSPHSASLIDIDGDCLSDLFLTVEDVTSGRKYYEIWQRRETATNLDISGAAPVQQSAKSKAQRKVEDEDEETPSNMLTGQQSFCLISREDMPQGTHNLISLVDVDRDGMVDMVYAKQTGGPIEIFTHFNRLPNQSHVQDQKNATPGLGFSVKHICAETNRPVKDLKDIFIPPNQANGLIGPDGVSRSDLVLMSVPFRGDSDIEEISSADPQKMPGRIHFGDVASDGFPDIMMTVENRNGTSTTHILMNDPCNKHICNLAAKEAKRRVFV